MAVVLVLLAPVVAARLAYNLTSTSSEPHAEPWAQDSMKFVTWNGEQWTGWIRGDEFELRPQNQDQWSNHASPSLAFLDWEGTLMQVKIEGDSFLLAEHGDWQGQIDSAIGVRYQDWNGNHQLRTVTQLRR